MLDIKGMCDVARVNNIQTDLQNVSTIESLRRFVGAALNSIVLQMNGKLDVVDNLRAFGPVQVFFSSTNTPTKVVHGLGRQPLGYWLIQQDAAGSVFVPDQDMYPWTPTQIYLSSSAIMNVSVFII